MSALLQQAFEGRRILITGDSGFKGSWLALWLQKLGAQVVGYSLEAATTPSHSTLAALGEVITQIKGDIRDTAKLNSVVANEQPDIVFHLAAQPLVLESYDAPQETFEVNSGGSVNLLDAVRRTPTVKALLIITTDKVYENHNWVWGYRENDRLGGRDPYSASKAMAELAVASYSTSFFRDGGTAVATARAGNIIGGGDFSSNRLLPDTMRALMARQPVAVRNPSSVRPWLHLLDPLYGYLLLAAALCRDGARYSGSWNFGPLEQEGITCQQVVEEAIICWGSGDWVDISAPVTAHPEMALLRLNWDKAAQMLNWRPRYRWNEAVAATVAWFQAFQGCDPAAIRQLCYHQIDSYLAAAPQQVEALR